MEQVELSTDMHEYIREVKLYLPENTVQANFDLEGKKDYDV